MSDVRSRLAAGGPPLVVAHRGAWRIASPENSRAAVRAAATFDFVEIDVRLSLDGVPMVMHDDTVDRTTEGHGAVRDATEAELTAIRLKDSAETIPGLDDILHAGAETLLFDIDVKDPSELGAVADYMRRHPMRHRGMLKMDVETPSEIEDLKALETQADTCVIAKSFLRTVDDLPLLDAMVQRHVAGAEVWFADLGLLRQATALGPPLTSYTLDDVHCVGLSDEIAISDPQGVWGALQDAGLRAIMTDSPGQLRRFLNDKE